MSPFRVPLKEVVEVVLAKLKIQVILAQLSLRGLGLLLIIMNPRVELLEALEFVFRREPRLLLGRRGFLNCRTARSVRLRLL